MDLRARVQGTFGVLRSGNATVRALSVADSRSFVRSQFLAAAAHVDLLPFVRTDRSVDEIAAHLGSRRPDRLAAFLTVGVELRELRDVDSAYRARGRRARAIANGDVLLTAHYRSMLDYQTSPYARLTDLLRADEGDGLSDLDEHATIIADVSLAAAPFVTPLLERVVAELRPSRALDVGCGTGVYTAALLDADARVRVDGIDLADDVVQACRSRLGPARAARVELHVGDVQTWTPPAERRYDLVTLVNDVYYFAPAERVALYRRLRELLTPSGELVVVTMLWPGSIASAHLHWMLVAQGGAAALPGRAELESDLRAAGFTRVVVDDLVPTEPFVGIRAGA